MGVGGTYLLALGFSGLRLGDWPGGGAGPPGAQVPVQTWGLFGCSRTHVQIASTVLHSY